MPRRIKVAQQEDESFGKRLARIRKAAGYTQQALAAEIGISPRMVAYYEGETDQPPTALLPVIARALDVTADELLGIGDPLKEKPKDAQLRRRLQQVEKLPARERRQILQFIDTVLEREELKRKLA